MTITNEFTIAARYDVLAKARVITREPGRDILDIRRYLGVPLAADMRLWLSEQRPAQLLAFDFTGVRAVTLSVAEELGPLLAQAIAQDPVLEHRYMAYRFDSAETLYTFAQAFSSFSWASLCIEPRAAVDPVHSAQVIAEAGDDVVAVLGQISEQMKRILAFAEETWAAGKPLTSETVTELDFLKEAKAAARSKRLTELHARRLLAFRENPNNPRERLFTPPWRL